MKFSFQEVLCSVVGCLWKGQPLLQIPRGSGGWTVGVTSISTSQVQMRLYYPAHQPRWWRYFQRYPRWLLSTQHTKECVAISIQTAIRNATERLDILLTRGWPIDIVWRSSSVLAVAAKLASRPVLWVAASLVMGMVHIIMSWVTLPCIEDSKAASAPAPGARLVVFSQVPSAMDSTSSGSGLLYSGIASELASFGFAVAVIEHRCDSPGASRSAAGKSSACRTFFGAGDWEPRHRALIKRQQEARAALDVLTRLSSRDPGVPLPKLVRARPRLRADRRASLPAADVLTEVHLRSLQHAQALASLSGRLLCNTPAVGGHALGGATALAACFHDARFSQCFCLDPWLTPVSERMLSAPMKCSLLVVVGDHAENILPEQIASTKSLNQLVEARGSHAHLRPSVFCTIPDARPEDFSDLGVVAESVRKTLTKDSSNHRPLDIRRSTAMAIIAFLQAEQDPVTMSRLFSIPRIQVTTSFAVDKKKGEILTSFSPRSLITAA